VEWSDFWHAMKVSAMVAAASAPFCWGMMVWAFRGMGREKQRLGCPDGVGRVEWAHYLEVRGKLKQLPYEESYEAGKAVQRHFRRKAQCPKR